MTAGRCPDCGAITVKDRMGLWVLRHKAGCTGQAAQLFDVTKTTETACQVCGATRLPGADKADGCWVDEKRAQGDYERRPRNCLNSLDDYAPFPEGF